SADCRMGPVTGVQPSVLTISPGRRIACFERKPGGGVLPSGLLPRRRGRNKRSEESVLLPIRPRREEQGIGRPVVTGALTEAERPEAVDGDRPPFGRL